MKAIIVEEFGTADNMKVAEVEVPSIQSHQLLIRVKTTSVNFADIKARYGNKGRGKLPFIPGLEAAGIVEAVGDNVQSISVGERVIAFPHHGSYAEYVVADENLTFVIPDSIDFDTAGASGIVSFLSYKLLVEVAQIQSNETVVIHSAAGGVGTTAIQIAKALGVKKVIGTVGSSRKIPTAVSAGADHVINYDEETIVQIVNELTDGKGADVILDSLGGEMTEESVKYLAKFGRLVVFGNSSGQYGQVHTQELHASCRSVLGFSLGTARKERPELLQETAKQVFRLIETGQLNINISKKLPLSDALLAHQLIESRSSTGKVLLYVDNE
ncbi:NADPH:quinone oxidoreductase family protein [Paenibacillus sp. GSMTC-2017]|uniref:quinone oxidoreductase family protein n=1 Tax=Paenibacillus sp. GSMTC-2017 TaxID=2794350 RepID=UPI0018D831C3|nr:NADPH:quinone oxidoreductase family protein [Paenibacillus sp. GSMTC-2017]MBH5319880.1 NADPH:quinone oxidoreductase family protein [Paenibacillus sp. GSMTC-2017]